MLAVLVLTILSLCWAAPADMANVSAPGNVSALAACAAHPECARANLTGTCCPNDGGVMLDCCRAQCSLHSPCVAAALSGLCCPTAEGAMLDCCRPAKESAGNGTAARPARQPAAPAPAAAPRLTAVQAKAFLARAATKPSAMAACAAHPRCAAANLTGTCCPSEGGLMLECCQAECSAHTACTAASLTGFCCPTTEGSMLDCCGGKAQVPISKDPVNNTEPTNMTAVREESVVLAGTNASISGFFVRATFP